MTPGQIKATKDLTWYFEHGIPSFERSALGAMLERAELYRVPRMYDRERVLASFARRPNEPPPHPVTARPTREVHACEREEPTRALLVRYGLVNRRLATVARIDPQAARALALAFGADGAEWARHARGRCVALFRLVPAGEALLARSKRVPGIPLSDAQRIRVQVVIDHETRGRDKVRRQLIAAAMREANELLTRALCLWVGKPYLCPARAGGTLGMAA